MVLVRVVILPWLSFPLMTFCSRPVDGGQRIPPSDFEDYGATHIFKNPSCLCAATRAGFAYTESDVCLATDGPYAGEYVARCATDGCGYFSKLDFVLHFVWCLIIELSLQSL